MSFMQNVMMKMGQSSTDRLEQMTAIDPKTTFDALDLYKIEEDDRFQNEAINFATRTGMSENQAKAYIKEHPLTYKNLKLQTTEQIKKEEKLLKDLGYAGAGAGLGGLGGYYLAKLIDDSATAKAIGTVLGTGLGGSLGYLYGDTAKDKAVEGYNYLKNKIV